MTQYLTLKHSGVNRKRIISFGILIDIYCLVRIIYNLRQLYYNICTSTILYRDIVTSIGQFKKATIPPTYSSILCLKF